MTVVLLMLNGNLFLSKDKERVTQKFPGCNPLNPKIKYLNSHLLPLYSFPTEVVGRN